MFDGWVHWKADCFQNVQTIMLSIDQCAESALGNRDFFLNKPQSVGGPGRVATFLDSTKAGSKLVVSCFSIALG